VILFLSCLIGASEVSSDRGKVRGEALLRKGAVRQDHRPKIHGSDIR